MGYICNLSVTWPQVDQNIRFKQEDSMRLRPAFLLLIGIAACHSAASVSNAPAPAPMRADTTRPHFTQADVHFMTGMIGHHAQALVMAGWAPTHDASPVIRTLCERIIVSQRDEIGWMQNWLR